MNPDVQIEFLTWVTERQSTNNITSRNVKILALYRAACPTAEVQRNQRRVFVVADPDTSVENRRSQYPGSSSWFGGSS